MTTFVLATLILLLLATNIFLWRYGFVKEAESPTPRPESPVSDHGERKAVLKRLWRWKEEGRLSREDFELFAGLCRDEWG